MRVAFDPASPERLRRFGVGLPFIHPTIFTADFAVEAPILVRATIDPTQPFRVGAFSDVSGGRLCHVSIGRYCSIAADLQTGWDDPPATWATTSAIGHARNPNGWATLLGHDDHTPPDAHPPGQRATTIGHDVWIGHGAFLRPGITIGDGAIIGARAVVSDDVPPYAVVEGSAVIRMRFDPATIARLQGIAWWRFNLFHLPPGLVPDVRHFLDHVEQAVAKGALEPYEPGWYRPDDIAALLA